MMPGNNRWLTLVGLLLLLSGCIREDRSDCPPVVPDRGYELIFFYPGNGTTDVFPLWIDHLEMFVYDGGDREVLRTTLSREDLEPFQGVHLDNLPAGDHTVICWGNPAEYSTFTGEGRLADRKIYQSQFIAGEPARGFDSLYFGRREITVGSFGEDEDTITFVAAHINMAVYIEGMDEVPAAGSDSLIVVRDVSAGYDFAMRPAGETLFLYPPPWSTDPNGLIVSEFNLPRFPDDNGIMLDIYDRAGELRTTVDLADFMERNGITVEGINEVTVPIYIVFVDGTGVRVTAPEWWTSDVTPVPR